MIKYEIKLKLEGEITRLPDSNGLFGALIGLSKEYSKEDEIDNYVHRVLKGIEFCMVSNLMPTGYYPMPKGFLYEKIQKRNNEITQNKNNGITDKKLYETIKKIEYIHREDLKRIIEDIDKNKVTDGDKLNKYRGVRLEKMFIQKFRLESQVKKLPGIPNVAYSLPIKRYFYAGGDNPKENANEEGERVENFSLYLVVDNKENVIGKTINQIKKNLEEKDYTKIISLGAKASTGYNNYAVESIEEHEYIEPKSPGLLLNMGMLLPNINMIKWEDSIVSIYTSDRKPFEINDDVDKAISFIEQGSIVAMKNENENMQRLGKSIGNKYNPFYKNAIIFGNSFFEGLEG